MDEKIRKDGIQAKEILDSILFKDYYESERNRIYSILEDWNGVSPRGLELAAIKSQILNDFKLDLESKVQAMNFLERNK